jgi:hypothetical protein
MACSPLARVALRPRSSGNFAFLGDFKWNQFIWLPIGCDENWKISPEKEEGALDTILIDCFP